MRIAIVFDDLIQFGGAERLLLAVHELYPDASVYTSVASNEWLRRCEDLRIDLKTSFMQELPFKKPLNRVYGLLGLHALAFESFNFDNFDTVLSISARFAHGVITKPGTAHICYMNSPGRMFWEPYDYFQQEKRFCQEKHFQFVAPFLSLHRLCDYASAQRVDYFIANSLTSKERIKKYYRRDSIIIYPFVDDLNVERTIPPSSLGPRPPRRTAESLVTGVSVRHDDYYLVITRLNAWKRVDVAIEACGKAGVDLKIIGEGPDRRWLEDLSQQYSRKVEFLGYVNDQEKYQAIANCRALIMTQKEDFGITALEAMALGKPVIAYKAGGALETVVESVTGKFFDVQNADCLATTIQHFDPLKYKPDDCKSQAAKFSKQKFVHQLDEFIKKVYDRRHRL